MFLLPPAWTHETRLPSEVGILELWDTPVPVINGTFIDSVYSSLPHHGLGHGLRSRKRLGSRDFKDLGACLRHYTSDRACESVGHSGYISALSFIGKSIV